jgi:hypothetical protein
MRTKNMKTDDQLHVSESKMAALVLAKLKGRVLFPEKIKSAKKYLKHINEKARV